MGIINEAKTSVGPNQKVQDSNLLEYMVTETSTSSPTTAVHQAAVVGGSPSRSSPRRTPNYRVRYNPVRDSPAGLHRRGGGGVRRTRRSENLNFLLGLAEADDPVENLTDLVEPTVTAFTELFLQHEKMKVWNDFTNRTEEDQERLLQESSHFGCSSTLEEVEGGTGGTAVVNGLGEADSTDSDGWEDLSDKRKVHPAFTPEECFKRIDCKLRSFLQKRQVPKGTLAYLEADVTSFFHEWPSSVLISKLSSSFERLLLHALCQYLDLRSHSFDDDKGERQTEVENKHKYFSPPEVTLVQYLEAKH